MSSPDTAMQARRTVSNSSPGPGSSSANLLDQSTSEPSLASKFGVSSSAGGNEDDPSLAHMTHFSDISKLRAAAAPDDFRLSSFNLERIHRFVDEPHAKLGKQMSEVAENVKGKSATVRDLVSPYVQDKKTSYSHGKRLQGKRRLILEHQRQLGPNSRFGDGDGTFWDRWLTTTGLHTKAKGYVPGTFPKDSSFQEGSVVPRSGFKMYNEGGFTRGGLIDTGNRRRVKSYSLYTKQSSQLSTSLTRKGQPQYSRSSINPVKAKKRETVAKTRVNNCQTEPVTESAIRDYDNFSSDSDDDDSSTDSFFGSTNVGAVDRAASASLRYSPSSLKSKQTDFSDAFGESKAMAKTATRPRGAVFKKNQLDNNVVNDYFGKNEHDWGAAKDNFFHLHHQLQHQKGHYTKEQYDSLLDVDYSGEEKEGHENKMLRLGGKVRSDSDAAPHKKGGKRWGVPKLDTEKAALARQREVEEVEKEAEAGISSSDDEFDIAYLKKIAGKFNNATARTRYIYGCIQARDGMGMPPRMGPIVRKFRTVKVDLSHQGMGDELAKIFSTALAIMPEVQRINLCDNRLSDEGVVSILEAVANKDDLYSLNLGSNKVDGDAAEKLATIMSNPACPWKELGLSSADVDDGECFRFIEALASNENLTSLDMSKNLIGGDESLNAVNPDLITGGASIAAMLASNNCRLKKLNLEWNFIRLDSAVEIGDALAVNKSLEYLNLDYNAFGADGGMAIGQSLIENCSLKTILLSHNGISPQAAFCIAVALRQNITLQRVDISGNPLGEIGGRALMALPMAMTSGLELVMDGCNFKHNDDRCWFDPEGPSGLFTEEAMRAAEEILEKPDSFTARTEELILEFNPNLKSGDSVISTGLKNPRNIRTQLEEVKSQFHQALDLSKPYDRAILIELLRFMAENDGCSMVLPEESCETDDTNAKFRYVDGNASRSEIQLVKVVESSLPSDGDEELHKWITGEKDPREVFNKFDKDGSGEIDKDELRMVFNQIGKDASDREIDRVMTQFDIDGSGSIELDEFVDFLQQLQAEMSEVRMKRKYMALPGSRKPWRPPPVGVVEFRIFYNPKLAEPGKGSSTNNATLDRVLNQAKQTNGEASTMLSMSLSMMRLGVEEAQRVFDELFKGVGDRVETLKLILPVMANSQQARVFVDMNLKDRDPFRNGAKCNISPQETFEKSGKATILTIDEENPEIITVLWDDGSGKAVVTKDQVTLTGAAAVTAESEKRRLQGALGYAYYPIMGIPTFHYKLDLSKSGDRMCLSKLAAINNTETTFRRKRRLGDTSQHGNWMNFRNEVFRGEPFKISRWFLDPIPKQGVLEFDYISTHRPISSIKNLSESRYLQLLRLCFGNEKESSQDVTEDGVLLKALARELNYDHEHGLWSPSCRKNEMGKEKFGLALATLMGDITPMTLDKAEESQRRDSEDKARQVRPQTADSIDEEFALGSASSSLPSGREAQANGGRVVDSKIRDVIRARMGFPQVSGGGADAGNNANFGIAALPKFDASNRFSVALMKKAGNNPAIAVSSFGRMKRLSSLLVAAAKIQNKARKRVSSLKLLQRIQDMVSTKWLSALQGRFLLDKFSRMIGISSDDTKLKLDMVCTLHQRIVDLYNFDVILHALNLEEQAHIVFRLGWLNTWSPVKPDMYYELSQSRREERLISKALLHLAVEEPGENWWDETFQWNRFDKTIPGWELPITWFTEDGMPRKGILKLSYYSGEGEKKCDCEPRWKLRNALSGLVLAECPAFLTSDASGKYKSVLRTRLDQLSVAQKMLLSGGIKLNYRQKK